MGQNPGRAKACREERKRDMPITEAAGDRVRRDRRLDRGALD